MKAILFGLGGLVSVFAAGPTQFTETTVFSSNEAGYDCFRIPAIVKTPNHDLLAFAEGRVTGCGDHGDIDIVMKRSDDNGKTWGALKVVAKYGDQVAGNPGPVVDEVTGEVMLLYNTSLTAESEIKKGNGIREVWLKTSADQGETWSASRNITLDVNKPDEPTLNPAYTFSEDWRWYAVTPGHALQMRGAANPGRLLIPANHNTATANGTSHCFWSDDHGKTWTLGGNAPTGTNEVTAVELTSGDILFNMRYSAVPGTRALALSADGGKTIGKLNLHPQLIAPVCQGSIIRYTFQEKHTKNRILISNPGDSLTRINMTVRLSYDEGETWPISRQVHSGFSAYSDLVILSDMDIGLLYEGGTGYGPITYSRFNLEWLSKGKDSLVVTPAALVSKRQQVRSKPGFQFRDILGIFHRNRSQNHLN